jgi:hypothetical protein
MSCCTIRDCSPTKITDSWVELKSSSSPIDQISVKIGVEIDLKVEVAKSMQKTLSVGISKGFAFVDSFYDEEESVAVIGEYSKSLAKMASAQLGVSVSVTTTAVGRSLHPVPVPIRSGRRVPLHGLHGLFRLREGAVRAAAVPARIRLRRGVPRVRARVAPAIGIRPDMDRVNVFVFY